MKYNPKGLYVNIMTLVFIKSKLVPKLRLVFLIVTWFVSSLKFPDVEFHFPPVIPNISYCSIEDGNGIVTHH